MLDLHNVPNVHSGVWKWRHKWLMERQEGEFQAFMQGR